MSWCAIDADLALVGYTKETVAGTFVAPATQQHILSGSHTYGHQPVIRSPHPGSRQPVHLDADVPGAYNPAVSLVYPLRWDDEKLQFEQIFGGAAAAGAWAIGATLGSWSLSIYDTLTWWKYAGCKVDSVTFTMAQGSPVTSSINYKALSIVEAAANGYTALALATAPTQRYYIYEDCAVLGGATATPATALEPSQVTITVSNGLHMTRAPGSRWPSCYTAGRFMVSGTLTFDWCSGLSAALQAAVLAYSIHYLRFTWTTGSRLVDILMPCKLEIPTYEIGEGSVPLAANVNFRAYGSDFSYTTRATVLTSSVYS